MADASKVTTKQGEAVGYLRGEWNKALEAVFAPPAGESKTWFGEFTSVLESIQTQWTDAFDTLMQKGSSFGDFMDSLWQGVLSSFRRMLAKIMAEELLYQMSGGKIERTFGIPRISHLWEPPSTYYEPGLKAPSYGARASTGLGGLSKAAVGETIINITNTGTPASLRETGRRFNGKQWVIDAVMEEYSINPNFREGMNR